MTAADDEVLCTSCDIDPALRILVSQITGIQPAMINDAMIMPRVEISWRNMLSLNGYDADLIGCAGRAEAPVLVKTQDVDLRVG